MVIRVAVHLVGAVDVAQQSVDPLDLGIVNPVRLKVGQDSGYVDQVAVVEMLCVGGGRDGMCNGRQT